MQEKDQKSFFDIHCGSKEIDFLEKFAIEPIILKKVLCIVSLHWRDQKLHVLSSIANLRRQSTGKLLFWVQDFDLFIFK